MNKINFKGKELDVKRQRKGQLWHNKKVYELTKALGHVATKNARHHDSDKLENGVIDIWARFQLVDNEKYEFDSPEYYNQLKDLGVQELREKHKRDNNHHAEFYGKDFGKMNLPILLEVISDWYAANKYRNSKTSKERMLEILQNKYKFTDELKNILGNTYDLLDEIENNK